jgi:small nuclear ribonucleoprotein G
MSRSGGPDLKKYMDKALTIKMNGNRRVSGFLRGYDQFLNLVLEDATEDATDGKKIPIGMVVLRGNGIIQLQSLDRLTPSSS